MSINSRIKERREELGLSRNDLADIIGVTPSAIANYENGVSSPKIELLYKLFHALKCDANYLYQDEMVTLSECTDLSLSINEQDHIKKYRSLSAYDKETVDGLVNRLSDKPSEFIQLMPPIVIPSYGHIASAGTGQYVFDDIPPMMIEIENTMENQEVSFAIDVNGDSMEPTYHDEDTLLVKKQNTLRVGEIGIFMINGEAYVKELGKETLISHNKTYNDIPLTEDIVCIGKVIGKIECSKHI